MHYARYRRRQTPFQRFVSDCRYYTKRYWRTALDAAAEVIVSFLFLAATIFGLPVIACLFY